MDQIRVDVSGARQIAVAQAAAIDRLEEATSNRVPIAALKRILGHRARLRRGRTGALLDWPAFDMLVDLAAVRKAGEHVSISAVCVSSGAPQSTALRKLAALEGAGLVRRYAHGADRRRVCVRLTDEAQDLVETMVADQIRFFSDLGRLD